MAHSHREKPIIEALPISSEARRVPQGQSGERSLSVGLAPEAIPGASPFRIDPALSVTRRQYVGERS